jgi:hypothetical protein
MSSILPVIKTALRLAETTYSAGLKVGRISYGPELFCGGSVTAPRPRKGDETRPDRLSPEPPPVVGANVNQSNDSIIPIAERSGAKFL